MSVSGVGSSSSSSSNTIDRQTIANNFDTFLQLLTTQLKNQNPLDPLDTNQFTQQLVEFSGVEQQLKTNDFLASLVTANANTTNSNASATIDGKTFPMVTDGEGAWLADTSGEAGFVEAMKAGSNLIVKGTSQRGTNTTDTYSLGGVTAAMQEIDKACA